jgi:outer membrane protein assembly factor BamB
MHRVTIRLATLALTAAPVVIAAQSRPTTAAWPHWRGPGHTGATTANVPLTWSDTSNVRWKIAIPGRGHSTPVAWGDRLFLTTAVPTGKKTDMAPAERGRGGAGGGASAGEEHRFEVLAVDRASGRIVWQQTAVTATPHEGYHRQYGSFASNAPATDGQRLYAFFGSRGLYVYDLNGKLLWQKDFGLKMTMHLAFGEGTGTVVHDGRLYIISDNGMLHVFDAATGTPHYMQQRLPKPYNFKASPLVVNDRVYLATEEGDVVVVKTGNQFEVVATNTLTDQSFIASPIAIGNDLYLRSRTHLFRISER